MDGGTMRTAYFLNGVEVSKPTMVKIGLHRCIINPTHEHLIEAGYEIREVEIPRPEIEEIEEGTPAEEVPAEQLANYELTDAQKALGNQDVITYTDEKQLKNEVPANGIADIRTVGLTLQDSVVMNFKFDLLNGATKDGLVAVVTAAGRTWEIEASEFTYEESSGRWVINFNGLNPAQMREKVSVHLEKDGVIVSDTATYSVESYGLSSAAKGSAKLAALVEAMARYGRSAKAYNG